jgi:hypothetical protein
MPVAREHPPVETTYFDSFLPDRVSSAYVPSGMQDGYLGLYVIHRIRIGSLTRMSAIIAIRVEIWYTRFHL